MPKEMPDWEKIKAEYISSDISQQKLAEKYGVHRSTLHRRMVKEGWQQLRKDATAKAGEKLVEIVADTQAVTLARMSAKQTRLAEAIYDKLIESVEKYPSGAGSRITRETVSVGSITLEDGSEKKIPLKSAIVTDLESIVRSMTNLGRLIGIDAGTKLDYERLALKVNPAAGQGVEDDDGFLNAISEACNDSWSIHDRPADLDDRPEGSLLKVLQESMNSVSEESIPELKNGNNEPSEPAEYTITGETREDRFVFLQLYPPPKMSPKKLMIDGHTYQRIFPRDDSGLPSIGIEADGSFKGKAVTLIE